MTRRDDDLRREIRQHLEMEAAEREADGLPAEEARTAALRAFGNVTHTREDARAVWLPWWLQNVAQDLRYALRLASRNRAFTAGAVTILALGISASTTIFAALNAVVLTPLPFDRPEQLVQMTQVHRGRGVEGFSVSLPLFRDWQQRSRSFQTMAAARDGNVTVQGLGAPQHVSARFVSHEMAALFGTHPALGRWFQPADDVKEAGPVVILSEGFWRDAFGADPSVVGRRVTIDGRPHEIIGVAAPDVLRQDARLLLPLVPFTEDRRGLSMLNVYGRLEPGTTLSDASAEMASVTSQLGREYPEDHDGWSVSIESLQQMVVGQSVPRMLYILLAAVGLLLLVTCANLSGLLLVKAASRTREVSIRMAMGGGRGRIVRQLVTESLLLAAVGGALGLGLSLAGVQLLRTTAATYLPRADEIQLNPLVMLFAVGISTLAGVLAGVAPARQVLKLDLQRGLKESARSITLGRNNSRNALVVAQLALSIVLLGAAGLTIDTLINLSRVDLGFNASRILTMRVAPRNNPEVFFGTLLERLRKLPDVVMVGATSGAPMTSENLSLNVYPVGSAVIPATQSIQSDWRVVTEGYFAAMEIPLLMGRDFARSDNSQGAKVIVVNQTLARQIWGEANPIGKQVDLAGGGGTPATVVGLVGDVRNHNPALPANPTYYVSAYRGVFGPMTLSIRTNVDASSMLPQVRAEVAALDPALPVFDVRTMQDLLGARLAPQRLVAGLLTGFAGLALVLAVMGIYGVMAYTTGQRTPEAAIRLALGATRWNVVGPLAREGSLIVAAGSMLGLAAAVPLTGLVGRLLSNEESLDPAALAAATVLLAAAALVACLVPAYRASRVDPARILRAG